MTLQRLAALFWATILAVLIASFFNSCNGADQMNFEGLQPGQFGGSFVVPPNTSLTPDTTTIGQEVPLFQFPPQQDDPEMVSVAFAASCAAPTNLGSSYGGPIVGIVNYGAGSGASQRIEVDVPVYMPNFTTGVGKGSDAGTGVILTLPASTLYVAARNDANLKPPAGTQTLGRLIAPPVIVTAHLTRGTGESGRVFRTVWISADNGGGGLASGANAFVAVPAGARSVRISRFDTAQAISVTLLTVGASLDGPYAVAAGAQSPAFDLNGLVMGIRVTNTGAANLAFCAAVFELGF